MRYRDYWIERRPKPGPTTKYDWDWHHEGYDGPGDPREGCSPDLQRAMRDVDENIYAYGDWDDDPPERTA